MKRWTLLLLLLAGWYGETASDASRSLPPPEPAGLARVRAWADRERCRQWVDSVMESLTPEERIGQLFIYTIAPRQDAANKALLRKVVETYKVGGLLFSGGQWQDQAALANEAQRMAGVPLMVTFDGEWGLAMRLPGMPSFPKNRVLGCIRDDSLIYEYGREMARQCREMGVQVNFAPVADVDANPANPVINERSFGEDPRNVARKAIAYARGLEAGGVLSVSKHFPGHGGTDADSHKTLPLLPFTRERLDSIELYPFRQIARAGLGGIMVGHLEVPALEPEAGVPASLSRNLVAGLLKEGLGFRGLAFTDALAMGGAGGHDTLCLQALKAGEDMLLAPSRIKEEMAAVAEAVKKGELPQADIDEKCRKVLACKYRLGLHRKPFVRTAGLEERIRTPETERLISRLNVAAITLAANRGGILPLDPSLDEVAVLSVGDAGKVRPFLQSLSRHVRPVSYRLDPGLPAAAQQRLADKLAGYKRVIVCVTGRQAGDCPSFFSRLRADVPVIFLFFVPQRQAAPWQQALKGAAAVLVAHSGRSDVQRRSAQILCGEAGADGRLSVGIGTLFAAGDGVTLQPGQARPRILPEDHGMSARVLARIDTIAMEGIRKGAYPGCQVVVLKDGEAVYDKAFGTYTWPRFPGDTAARPATPAAVYDIASLTKPAATLLAVMKLYDKGRISLADRLADRLPSLRGTDKGGITVRELLLHESGLPSTLLFYEDAIDPESYPGTLFKGRKDALHPVRIGSRTWANPHFRFKEGLTARDSSAAYALQVADSLWLHRSFKDSCMRRITGEPLRDKRYRYSCVGFILLQQLVEAEAGMPLDKFLQQEFYGPMGLERTGYLPLRRLPKEEIVPSADDPFLRKSVLQGFVHDESAAFLGGVSGNAGLFSTAEEVAALFQLLLDEGEWKGKRYLGAETCRLFTTTVSRISRRGLGFDKPDPRHPDKSPCAASAPASVYGHTGFTGTCAWADPENGMVYVFLCNRLFPDVWNTKLTQLDIRTRIQEVLYEALRAAKTP